MARLCRTAPVRPLTTSNRNCTFSRPLDAGATAPARGFARRPFESAAIREDAIGNGDDGGRLAGQIRAELRPSTAIERVLCERIVRLATRLSLVEAGDPDGYGRELATQAAFIEALAAFDRHRDRPVAARVSALAAPIAAEPAPGGRLTVEGEAGPSAEELGHTPRWQDRLVIDPTICETSPVVRGTPITVREVISAIVDGQSWDEIRRNRPQLHEDDIRACLSYTIEDEGSAR